MLSAGPPRVLRAKSPSGVSQSSTGRTLASKGVPLTAVSLVRKGYFPRELPPAFSTEKLARLLERDRTALPQGGKRTQCVRHNLARPGGFRRPLQVPNPRSFVGLAEEFEAQWPAIRKHVRGNAFSTSRPVVTLTLERAVRPRFRMGERDRLRPRDWRGQRFVLRTDVNQFYSSLYTHAIPWALEGKQTAKQNIGKTTSDRLDKAMRNVSDGQTMGVPVGPDTSFLAAEIVLTAVDKSLASKLPLRGHRYLDDYELAFTTRSAAEEAQALLEDTLADYELAINPTKTKILELPQPFHEGWTHELSTFDIRSDSASKTISDLIALFSHAAAISRARSGPLKYALLRSREIEIGNEEVWVAFQNLVWSAVSAEPTTMAPALDLLEEKSTASEFEIDRDAAGEVIEALIRTHSPVRNASEVAWGLWASIVLDVKMTKQAAKGVADMEDDFVALLALDASSRGLFGSNEVDASNWETLTDYDGVMSGPHWLLAYEGSVRKWLKGPRRYVTKDRFFRTLRRRRVRFYDPDPSPSPYTGPAGPLPGGLVPDEYV